MAKPAPAPKDVAWVQLAIHVPKNLHRDIKMHCVRTETKLMAFVVAALEEKLGLAPGPKTTAHVPPPRAVVLGRSGRGRQRP
jgi:hypothetical protein